MSVGCIDYIVGIDPGQTGAWVQLNLRGEVIQFGKMLDIYKMKALFKEMQTQGSIHIFMEKAQAMPKNGAVSMFNYGDAFGELKGVLIGLDFTLTLVRPPQWTKEMHMGTSGDDPKLRSYQAVNRLFPNANLVLDRCRVPHKGIIDALLIAEFGRRQLCKM